MLTRDYTLDPTYRLAQMVVTGAVAATVRVTIHDLAGASNRLSSSVTTTPTAT